MFEGYKEVDFMTALRRWDELNKKAKCICFGEIFDYGIDSDYKSDFKVDGRLILEGIWYSEV